jgi:hypothetical protein
MGLCPSRTDSHVLQTGYQTVTCRPALEIKDFIFEGNGFDANFR